MTARRVLVGTASGGYQEEVEAHHVTFIDETGCRFRVAFAPNGGGLEVFQCSNTIDPLHVVPHGEGHVTIAHQVRPSHHPLDDD